MITRHQSGLDHPAAQHGVVLVEAQQDLVHLLLVVLPVELELLDDVVQDRLEFLELGGQRLQASIRQREITYHLAVERIQIYICGGGGQRLRASSRRAIASSVAASKR